MSKYASMANFHVVRNYTYMYILMIHIISRKPGFMNFMNHKDWSHFLPFWKKRLHSLHMLTVTQNTRTFLTRISLSQKKSVKVDDTNTLTILHGPSSTSSGDLMTGTLFLHCSSTSSQQALMVLWAFSFSFIKSKGHRMKLCHSVNR